jgi:hypothetical protein
VSFLFAERVLLQSGTISAPRSTFQEAVREFSVPRMHAPSVRNDFCSPSTCV